MPGRHEARRLSHFRAFRQSPGLRRRGSEVSVSDLTPDATWPIVGRLLNDREVQMGEPKDEDGLDDIGSCRPQEKTERSLFRLDLVMPPLFAANSKGGHAR